jgi:hypothetical protein
MRTAQRMQMLDPGSQPSHASLEIESARITFEAVLQDDFVLVQRDAMPTTLPQALTQPWYRMMFPCGYGLRASRTLGFSVSILGKIRVSFPSSMHKN